MSFVSHDAAQRDAFGLQRLPCQRQRRLARLDPASSLPDIEVDEHANARAASRAARESASSPASESIAAVTRTRLASAATRAHFSGATISLASRMSSQNSGSDLGFADRRTGQSGARAGSELTLRDLRRLVRFEMRPQPARSLGKERRHAGDVAIQRGHIQDEGRCWDFVDALADRLRDILVIPASGRHDSERSHLLVEIASLDAEHFGGARHVAVLIGERAQDVLLLELVARVVERRQRRRARSRAVESGSKPCSRKLRSRDDTRSPGTMIISRSTRFRSSRTLPGHL